MVSIQQAIATFEHVGDVDSITYAMCHSDMGKELTKVDANEAALSYMLRARVLMERIASDDSALTTIYGNLATIKSRLGRLGDAGDAQALYTSRTRRSQVACAGLGCSRKIREDGTPLTVCTRCNSTHYCSTVCQRSDWELQHRAECSALVAAAAAVAKGAAADAMAPSKGSIDVTAPAAAAAVPSCAGPGCSLTRRPDGAPLDMCNGCKRVCYCGKACQTAGWKVGHRAECKAIREDAAGDGDGARGHGTGHGGVA